MALAWLVCAAAPSASAGVANVIVTNFAFVPAMTNIFVNDTVIWTWPPENSQNHDVFSLSTPAAWASSAILSGPATFTNTFTATGTYPYLCTVHGFTGSIVVNPAPPPVPVVTITSPANGSVLSAPASFTLAATASETNGVITNVEFLQGATVLGNVAAAPYSVPITSLPAGNFTFTAIASDTNGMTATNSVSIQVVAGNVIFLSGNLNFGVVAVGSPASATLTISNGGGTTMTVSNIVYPAGFSGPFSGTVGAAGSQAVTVTFSPTAPGFYSGAITVNSDAPNGVNTISASGFGSTGNLVLTLLTNGGGRVSPNLGGRTLTGGVRYTLTAIAGKGEIFSNWSGSTNSSANPLTFIMQPGTIFEANFVPNPFAALAGTYNGLFAPGTGVVEGESGMLKGLIVRPNGAYSGALLLGGRRESFSGRFTAAGKATNTLACVTPGGTVTVKMSLSNIPPPQILGTVAGSNWLAALMADRAANPLPSSAYTLLLLPENNSPAKSPGGAGWAALTNHAGAVRINGALADGAAVNEAASISQDGYVPVFANLYGGKGLLLGWINLGLTNTAGVGLTWIRPPRASGLYPLGFTNVLSAAQAPISPWTNPPADLGLLTNLIIADTLYMANPAGAVTDSVAITGSGAITGAGVTGAVNLRTGQFKVTIGGGPTKVTGFGAILLDQTNGGGYFLTKTNAQAVELSP